MYQLLKNLSPTQQVGTLFVIVFGFLLIASAASGVSTWAVEEPSSCVAATSAFERCAFLNANE